MKEILAILILCLPLIWELYNDAHGDLNKAADIYVRLLIATCAAFAAYFIADRNLFLAFALSLGIHWLLFDFLIHMLLYRNGVIVSPRWFYVLGKKGFWDKIKFWRSIGPYGRLFVKLFYFLGSIFLYFKF